MNGDLISRRELLKKECCGRISGDDVRNAPAIDAAPVVHGRWISHFDRSECSVCGGICWADSASTYDYCPNCGAKMDLEAKHDD